LYVIEEFSYQKSLRLDTVIINIKVPFVWKHSDTENWWMATCNNCHNPVLILNAGDKIYPTSLSPPSDERIPEHIGKDLDEAKLCFSVGAYRTCAVMSRRTL